MIITITLYGFAVQGGIQKPVRWLFGVWYNWPGKQI